MKRPAARVWFLLFLPLFSLFFLTAEKQLFRLSADPVAAALSSWTLVEHGSLTITPDLFVDIPRIDQRTVRDNAWLVPTGDRIVSNRQPGVIASGLPFYGIASVVTSDFSITPMRVAAAFYAAGAAATLGVLLLSMGATSRQALAFPALGALGTSTWSVAADSLWTHGPNMFLLSSALLLASKNRNVWAGLALGLAVPVRTHLAVVALCLGVALALDRRSARPLLSYGIPAAAGIVAVLAYTHAVFGTWSLNAGYTAFGGYPQERLASTGAYDALDVLTNVGGFLFSPDRGLLLGTPVLVLLVLGLKPAWSLAPGWARASAAGGLLYTLVQARLNYFSGGERFYSYRLTLELLLLVAPLLWLSCRHLSRRGSMRRSIVALAAVSVSIQTVGAVFTMPWRRIDPWGHWWLLDAMELHAIGLQVRLLMLTGMVCAAFLMLYKGPRRPTASPSLPRSRTETPAARLTASPAAENRSHALQPGGRQ